jgi:hypothetical protein
MEYDHAGKTVLVDDSSNDLLWIEGESNFTLIPMLCLLTRCIDSTVHIGESDGDCPLADISPFQLSQVQETFRYENETTDSSSSSGSWLPDLGLSNLKPSWMDNVTVNVPDSRILTTTECLDFK